MLLSKFFSKSIKSNVSLDSVIEKFKFSREAVLLIFSHTGFETANLEYLNENHLEILSQSYIDSVKNQFNSFSKNFYNYSKKDQQEFKAFYSRFVQSNYKGNKQYQIETDKGLINSKLNSDKIKNYFFARIQEIELLEFYKNNSVLYFEENNLHDLFSYFRFDGDSEAFDRVNKIIGYKLKPKVKRKLTFSKLIFRIMLINSHYHVFIDDEEHYGVVISKYRFSVKKINCREALKIIHLLKLYKPCINTSKLLKT